MANRSMTNLNDQMMDYSLLAPRPYKTGQHYQSVTTSASGSGATSPRFDQPQNSFMQQPRSPSPAPQPLSTALGDLDEEFRRVFERRSATPTNSFLSPQEPAEWGFIGEQQQQRSSPAMPTRAVSPKPPMGPSGGGGGTRERMIPIKVMGGNGGQPQPSQPAQTQQAQVQNQNQMPSTNFTSPLSNGDSFFADFDRSDMLGRRFADFRTNRDRPPSVLGIPGHVGRSERIIPVRMEGGPGGARRLSVPTMEIPQQQQVHQIKVNVTPESPAPTPVVPPVQLPPPPLPIKTVRFSDYEEHRRITPPEPSSPVLTSPVFAEERRAPVRGGSLVRQIPVIPERQPTPVGGPPLLPPGSSATLPRSHSSQQTRQIPINMPYRKLIEEQQQQPRMQNRAPRSGDMVIQRPADVLRNMLPPGGGGGRRSIEVYQQLPLVGRPFEGHSATARMIPVDIQSSIGRGMHDEGQSAGGSRIVPVEVQASMGRSQEVQSGMGRPIEIQHPIGRSSESSMGRPIEVQHPIGRPSESSIGRPIEVYQQSSSGRPIEIRQPMAPLGGNRPPPMESNQQQHFVQPARPAVGLQQPTRPEEEQQQQQFTPALRRLEEQLFSSSRRPLEEKFGSANRPESNQPIYGTIGARFDDQFNRRPDEQQYRKTEGQLPSRPDEQFIRKLEDQFTRHLGARPSGGGDQQQYRPLSDYQSRPTGVTWAPDAWNSNSSSQQQQQREEAIAPPIDAPPMVMMYDAAVFDGPFKEFVQLSQKIGGDVESMGALTRDAFQAQRVFLWKAAGIGKPSETEMATMLRPISEKIEAIQGMTSAKRQSAFFNHLSAISEGIPALGWVTVSPTPAPFVKEMSDASMFYTNRVLKDFKEKDKTHTDWVKAWLQTLSELQKFVKQNHTTGLVWNTTPGACPPAAGATPKSASAGGGGPPPPPPISGMPPPPPPPPPPADFGKNTESDADSRAALFAEINKGLDVTRGLKKVTADMQTHKNPALREAAPVSGVDPSKPVIPPKPAHLSNGGGGGSGAPSPPPAAAGGKKPSAPEPTPVLALEGGKKWMVEYHKGNRNITVEVADMRQVVYIYKCVDCVVQIKGKANSITMDSCKKTSVVFENLLSCLEIINCQSAQVQTLGAMPTLTIQKTDGCQVYLSKDSLNAEIVTSKSSEMNILVPDESGEFREFPVPEQYRTMYKGNKLVTEVVDIA